MISTSFLEWKTLREAAEPSGPKAGDLVITNPKAFMNSVMSKNGKLKNNGKAAVSSFSRFKVKGTGKDGLLSGVVQHNRYSGGIRRKFDPQHTLDVTDAFDTNGQRVYLHVTPNGRASEYIQNAYPIWKFQMSNGEIPWQKPAPEPEPEVSLPEPEPEVSLSAPEPEVQPSYVMQGRNVVPMNAPPKDPTPSFFGEPEKEPDFSVPEPADLPEPELPEPSADFGAEPVQQLAAWHNPWKYHTDRKVYAYFD